jgi:hypothetical protein
LGWCPGVFVLPSGIPRLLGRNVCPAYPSSAS